VEVKLTTNSPKITQRWRRTLSWLWFVIIGGGRWLSLLASKLSADSFCNSQNSRVKQLTGTTAARPLTSR
jgi:hypothetical protein